MFPRTPVLSEILPFHHMACPLKRPCDSFFKVRASACIILNVYSTFSSVAANPLKTLLLEGVHENGSGSTHARLYSVKETDLFEIIIFLSSIH